VEAYAPPPTPHKGTSTKASPPMSPPESPPIPPPDLKPPKAPSAGIEGKFENIAALDDVIAVKADEPRTAEASCTKQFREGLGPPLTGEAAAKELLGDLREQPEEPEEDDWDNVMSIELGMKECNVPLLSQSTSTMASSSGLRTHHSLKNRYGSTLGVVSDTDSDQSRAQERGDELLAERMSVHDIEAMVVDLVDWNQSRQSVGTSFRQRQPDLDAEPETARKTELTSSSAEQAATADDEDLMEEILKDLAAGKGGGRHSIAGDASAHAVLA